MAVKIHFLNVGSGDCTIVHFPARTRKDGKEKAERIMMIDLNHHEDHKDFEHVIDYYKNKFRDENNYLKPIFRFICTHPHHDHFCGFKKLFDNEEIKIWNFWDLDHEFEPENFDGHPWHKEDWDTYQEKRSNKTGNPTIIRTYREDKPRLYWNDEEDRISILAPSLEMIKKAHEKEDGSKRDPKDVQIDSISYALAIKINSKKVILAGDGKEDCWQNIFDNCSEGITECNILKAGHHGHESGFHEKAVKLMNPNFIIFSNSKEEDKENGAEKLYKNVLPNSQIYKTHEKGTIIATLPYNDNEKITFDFQ